MKQVLPLIEEDPPSKFIRFLVWLADAYNTVFFRTHVPVFYFLCSVYMYRKLRWIIRIPAYFCILVLIGVSILTPLIEREMVISVAPWTYVRTAKAAELGLPETTVQKIKAAFGPHADTFLKIAMAESGQQAGNKGYNCFYGGESMACKPGDEKKAWSVDCGLLMINVHGTLCPPELFDIDVNIKAAQGKFDRQGFKAWSVCRKKVKCI